MSRISPSACVFLMHRYDQDELHINVGTGEDLTIAELAQLVRDIVYPDAVYPAGYVEAGRRTT